MPQNKKKNIFTNKDIINFIYFHLYIMIIVFIKYSPVSLNNLIREFILMIDWFNFFLLKYIVLIILVFINHGKIYIEFKIKNGLLVEYFVFQ